jgi:ABC-type glutathione transport system ATPase component
MPEALLELEAVSKSFPLRGGVWRRTIGRVAALEAVSLRVDAGEGVGLVGESGCGKTTLARVSVGLVRPTQGRVRVGGGVQLIFQDPTGSLNPRMTVEETLAEPLIIHRLGTRADRGARIEALLESVGLPAAHRRRLPRELSGGERQRVGIARALAVEPGLLICDEPIASLDVSVGSRILELLRSLRQARRLSLLFISHDLRAVAALCERIAVMRAGRIVEQGPTEAVIRRPRHPYTDWLIRCADLDLDAEPAAGDAS